jgi:hypothetical protein
MEVVSRRKKSSSSRGIQQNKAEFSYRHPGLPDGLFSNQKSKFG